MSNSNSNNNEETLRQKKERQRKDFVKTFNLPNSQFHFKPEKIKAMTTDEVLLRGREGMSNNIINLRITRDMFNSITKTHPRETRFLLDDWRKRGANNDNMRDSCTPTNRDLL